MIDVRTEQERRYDAERDGTLYRKPEPSDNPLLEAARWLDRLEVAREADRALRAASPRIMPDGTLNKYDTGEYSLAKAEVRTPLNTLSNGAIVEGLHDVDGSPLGARFETEDGSLYASRDGTLNGQWAGVDLDLNADQLAALRRLLMSTVIEEFLPIAAAWDRGQLQPCQAEPPADDAAPEARTVRQLHDWIDHNVDLDVLAGRAGALMTTLYRALDDDRAAALGRLLSRAIDAAPAERDRLVDALLAVA